MRYIHSEQTVVNLLFALKSILFPFKCSSSKLMQRENSRGKDPVKELSLRFKYLSARSFPKELGNVPLNLLLHISRILNLEREARSSGIPP